MSTASRVALGIGIPTLIGAGLGAVTPVRAKSPKNRKKERVTNIVGGAASGAILGTMLVPALLPPVRTYHVPRHSTTHTTGGGSFHPTPRASGGSSYSTSSTSWASGGTSTPTPRATVKQTVSTPGINVGSIFSGGRPSPGKQSWQQAAQAGIPKPPSASERAAAGAGSHTGSPKIHLPSREEVEALDIAQRMGLPKKPTSRAEINEVLKTEAKKFHSDVGGDPSKMQELTRWHSYWKEKVSAYHPQFQDGFVEELSKIASL